MQTFSSSNLGKRQRPSGRSSGPSKRRKVSHTATIADVKRIVMSHLEPKFVDNKIYTTTATSAGVQYSLSSVPQGDTDSSRSGDQINIQSLEVIFDPYLQGVGGTNDFTDTVRLILYRWHPMSTATQPTQADILQDQSVAQSNEMSLYKWDNRKDYTIIDDLRFPLSANGPSIMAFRKKYNLNNVAAHFTAGSATLCTNQIYAFVASDSLLATHPLFDLYSRVVYLDA